MAAVESLNIKHAEEKPIPKVSIGMPVYNGERFIRKALDSLLAQTFTDFELIISDNASTDATPEICKEYAKRDNRIRFIRQPKNMGAIWNFNFVLQEAQGEYFMWAASDDMWASNWIEVVLDNFCGHSVISFGRVVNIWENGKIRLVNPALSMDGNIVLRLLKFPWVRSAKPNLIYGLFRTNYLKQIFLSMFNFLCSLSRAEDIYILYRVLHDGTIVSDPSVNFYKRWGGVGHVHEEGVTRVINKLFPIHFLFDGINFLRVQSPLWIRILQGLNQLFYLLYRIIRHYLDGVRSIWRKLLSLNIHTNLN